MKWKLVGGLMLIIGCIAAWQAGVHMADQTRTIIEISIAIVVGGIGIRLLFPRTED